MKKWKTLQNLTPFLVSLRHLKPGEIYNFVGGLSTLYFFHYMLFTIIFGKIGRLQLHRPYLVAATASSATFTYRQLPNGAAFALVVQTVEKDLTS